MRVLNQVFSVVFILGWLAMFVAGIKASKKAAFYLAKSVDEPRIKTLYYALTSNFWALLSISILILYIVLLLLESAGVVTGVINLRVVP